MDSNDVRSIAQMITQQLVQESSSLPGSVSVGSTPHSTAISQITASIMGGRNEQASKKQKYNGSPS